MKFLVLSYIYSLSLADYYLLFKKGGSGTNLNINISKCDTLSFWSPSSEIYSVLQIKILDTNVVSVDKVLRVQWKLIWAQVNIRIKRISFRPILRMLKCCTILVVILWMWRKLCRGIISISPSPIMTLELGLRTWDLGLGLRLENCLYIFTQINEPKNLVKQL